MVTRRKWGAG